MTLILNNDTKACVGNGGDADRGKGERIHGHDAVGVSPDSELTGSVVMSGQFKIILFVYFSEET